MRQIYSIYSCLTENHPVRQQNRKHQCLQVVIIRVSINAGSISNKFQFTGTLLWNAVVRFYDFRVSFHQNVFLIRTHFFSNLMRTPWRNVQRLRRTQLQVFVQMIFSSFFFYFIIRLNFIFFVSSMSHNYKTDLSSIMMSVFVFKTFSINFQSCDPLKQQQQQQ